MLAAAAIAAAAARPGFAVGGGTVEATADGSRGDALKISWNASPECIGAEVCVYTVEHIPEAGETVASFNFDSFANESGNPVDATALLFQSYPQLGHSSLVYLPARSSGAIQLSKYNECGVLAIDGLGDFAGLTLLAVLKRYNYDKEARVMSIGWESPGGATNLLCAASSSGGNGQDTSSTFYLPLADDFVREAVPLDGVPSGARLLLNVCEPRTANKKTHHRIIFDSIDFVRGWAAAHTETNVAGRVQASSRNSAWVHGLRPNTAYCIRLDVFHADGTATRKDFAAPTSGLSRAPFAVILR